MSKRRTLTPGIIISVVMGFTLILTAVLIMMLNANGPKTAPDTSDVSSSVSVSSEDSSVTSSTDSSLSSSTESQSGTSSSAPSVSSNNSTTSSEYDIPSYTGLPYADDDPFKDNTPAGERVCYLTFDDGPCAKTDTILKILAENDIKATFFVVGTMSTGRIVDIYNAGHAIGLHTGTHDLNSIYKSPTAFLNDLKSISDTVYKKTGIRTNLTRFPGGSTTARNKLGTNGLETVKETMQEHGYTYFDWNIDSGDTHSKSPSKEYVMNQIKKNLLDSNGNVKRDKVTLLMHDIKGVTVEALPDIIKLFKQYGFTFKTLDAGAPTFKFC
ncbi:MAG: polysaccharide deacetylase [Ruminococcaceae bacterium]|nr:polysaccharide deacetylase [Oscillospiraceae bacterium]